MPTVSEMLAGFLEKRSFQNFNYIDKITNKINVRASLHWSIGGFDRLREVASGGECPEMEIGRSFAT